MSNLAALRAAVFPLSAKKPEGGYPPPAVRGLNGLLLHESNAELSALSNGGLEKRNICFHR